jgi:hypothetical protein
LMATQSVLAQTPREPEKTPVPERVDPKACSDQQRPLATEQQRPPARNETQGRGENLSEKLERSEGVICPPLGVDPEIVEPPPATGRTPVIPPPGSPGGDPTIRPK